MQCTPALELGRCRQRLVVSTEYVHVEVTVRVVVFPRVTATLNPVSDSPQVWDLTTGACDQTLTHHAGKVQAVAWNAAEASVLLSGGFDRAACMVRAPWHLHYLWPFDMVQQASAGQPRSSSDDRQQA
jgi:hypothetical protein